MSPFRVLRRWHILAVACAEAVCWGPCFEDSAGCMSWRPRQLSELSGRLGRGGRFELSLTVSTKGWEFECHSVPKCSFLVTSPRALFMLRKIRILLSHLIISASGTNQWCHFVEPERDLRYVGKILEGFSLASKPLSSKKVRKPFH